MAKYIPLDALVAEIERRIENLYPKGLDVTKILKDHYEDLLSFIDTLKEKEVDLTEEVQRFAKECGYNSAATIDYQFAEHFFKLGLKTQVQAIWHNVSKEIPTKYGEDILVACRNKNMEDGIWLYDLIQSWEGEWSPRVNWEDPVKWAYVNDLRPKITNKAKKGE